MKEKLIPVVFLHEKGGEGPEVWRLDIQSHGERFFTHLRRNVEREEHTLEVKEITVKEWQIIELNSLHEAGEITFEQWEKRMFKLTGEKPSAKSS